MNALTTVYLVAVLALVAATIGCSRVAAHRRHQQQRHSNHRRRT